MSNNEYRKSGKLTTAGFFLCAFLGGMTAQMMFVALPAQALEKQWERFFMIQDKENNPFGIQTYTQNGGTAQKYFDPRGQVRMQIGTYPNGTPEAGQPLLAMTDENGNDRSVLRLRGERQVPVLVFKDANNKDRLIMGLEDSLGEEPYLTTYDSSGQPLVRFSKLR